MKPHESEALARGIVGGSGASNSGPPSTHASRADSSALDDPALADLFELLTEHLASPAEAIEAILRDHPAADRLRRLLPTLKMLAGVHSSAGTTTLNQQSLALPSLLGDYSLIREIGRGGMGIVYEAEQISLKRRVALKILPLAGLLDDRLLKRFQVEAQAAAGLAHENIVPIYAVGCDQGVHYYAMQLIDGVSLAEVIAALRDQGSGFGGQEDSVGNALRGVPIAGETDAEPMSSNLKWQIEKLTSGPARYRRVAELGIQAAEALHHAHEAGILHRDIKPANLLLDKDGKLWITDFGLARIEGDANLTMTGDFLGTLRYMSPEQVADDHSPLDRRTDIYSLGATLYEILSGQPAITANSRGQMIQQINSENPPPLRHLVSRIPGDLEIILAKTLAKNPADRYASAAALAGDLRAFLTANPIDASRPQRKAPLTFAAKAVIAATVTLCVVAASPALRTHYSVPGTSTVAALPVPQAFTPQSNSSFSADANLKYDIPNLKSAPIPIPPPPGLIAWWSGDGTADDLVGNNHGNLVNGATFAPGLVGRAFYFDGQDDFVQIPNSDSIETPDGFTVEGWIRMQGIPGYQNIISKWRFLEPFNTSFSFQRDLVNGTLRVYVAADTGDKLAPASGKEPVLPGRWTHVAAACDIESVKVYYNGTQDGMAKCGRMQRSSCDVLIGASTGERGVNCHFAGLIDELSLYNRALQASEIAAIYHAGAAGKIKPSTVPKLTNDNSL